MNKQSIIDYYNRTAPERQRHKHMRRYYHRSLERYFSFIIPPGSRVLEIGCGTGELLAAMRPAYGVGIDFSERMIEIARRTFPELRFEVDDIEELRLSETFDYLNSAA